MYRECARMGVFCCIEIYFLSAVIFIKKASEKKEGTDYIKTCGTVS